MWAWLSCGRLKVHLAKPLVAPKPQNLGYYVRAAVSGTSLMTYSSAQQAMGAGLRERHTAPGCLQGDYFLP